MAALLLAGTAVLWSRGHAAPAPTRPPLDTVTLQLLVDGVVEAGASFRPPATYNRACRFALDPGALARSAGEVLGVPFDLQSPAYRAAVERVRAAAGRHGKACGPSTHDLRGGQT